MITELEVRPVMPAANTAASVLSIESRARLWTEYVGLAAKAAEEGGNPGEVDAAWCYLVHEKVGPISSQLRRYFEDTFKMTVEG